MSLYRAVYVRDEKVHGMTFATSNPAAALAWVEKIVAPAPVLTLNNVKSRIPTEQTQLELT